MAKMLQTLINVFNKQALAFLGKFLFLFDKVIFHFRIIRKKPWDWESRREVVRKVKKPWLLLCEPQKNTKKSPASQVTLFAKVTFLMGDRKNDVKFHRITSYTWNSQNFTRVITILGKFDINFPGLAWEIFFGVTTDDLLHLLSPSKM